MRTPRRLALGLCVAIAVIALPAVAAQAATTWYQYGVFGYFDDALQPAPSGSGKSIARLSQIILPASFKAKVRGSIDQAGGRYIAFGPVGSCRNTGSVKVKLVESDRTDAKDVVADQLPAAKATYGYGTRGAAYWRVVNIGNSTIRGAYAREATGPLAGKGVWVVVLVGTTPHTTCHAGGYRESTAYPIADALATVKASGY